MFIIYDQEYEVMPRYIVNIFYCKSDVWLTVHRNSVWIRKPN